MSYETTVADMLRADATLIALYSIGLAAIVQYEDMPSEGITRSNTPALYAASGFRVTFTVVRGRDTLPGPLNFVGEGYRTTVQGLDIYTYADADNAFSSITPIMDRIYTLLNDSPLTGGIKLKYRGETRFREQDFGNAPAIRLAFDAIGKKET